MYSAHPVPCGSRYFPLSHRENRNNAMVLACRAALLAFGLSSGVLGNAQQPSVNVATPVSAADASCGQCHAQILHNYLATPMANASGFAVERLKTGAFEHKPSGVKYNLSLEGSQLVLTYQDPKDSEIVASRKLEYFLGSGHLGLDLPLLAQ
jgi:hypothetical protein